MITELIFDWAKRTPDRTAVVYNGHPLSYAAFAQSIAKARGYFARHGYGGPGYAVLAVLNLKDFWVLSLALRSLGLTTVVALPAAPQEALGLPGVRCVVTTPAETWPGLDGLCAAQGLTLLSVSLEGERALGLHETETQYAPGGHVLRTSGTTGNYKMVLMSSATDAVLLQRRVENFGLDRNTLLCLFGFTASSGSGYKWPASPWSVGGATLIEQEGRPHRALLRPGITHALTVPAMLAKILARPADAFPRNDAMQLIVTAGPMTRSQIDQAKSRITPRLFNFLASTEADGIALTSLDAPEDHLWHRLMPGREVEIVDEWDRPVPTGETGRVRIGTAGGPTSYLNDEAATQTFFKDGFFYPGDLAAMRSDGRMALQGRLTDVINVRGRKISPEPIEARLAEIFGVSGVCLLSMQNDNGEEELHIVIETPVPLKLERLIPVLSDGLRGFPGHHIHQVANLPRNQMGKMLRQAVRAQAIAGDSLSVPMDQPQS